MAGDTGPVGGCSGIFIALGKAITQIERAMSRQIEGETNLGHGCASAMRRVILLGLAREAR
jgi:hypothetical protein